MNISVGNFNAIQEIFSNEQARKIFSQIVENQGVNEVTLRKEIQDYSDEDLNVLIENKLVARTPNGVYVPSARGLSIADDLKSVPILKLR